MRTILVTGSTGFIGKKLVPVLIKKYKVVCFVKGTTGINELKKMKANIAFGDMLDKSSVFRATKNIDIVIHLATSHKQGNEDFNFIGSKNIVEACKKNKVKKLIFISSMAVKRKMLDDYGRTKLKIEKMIKKSGLDYIILRPSMIYSNDNLSLIKTTLVSLPFIIPIIGNGKYKLNPVHIDDVVLSISKAIESKKMKADYDVAGAEKISFNEIINICKKRFNVKKVVIHIPISICLIIFRFFPIASLEAIRGINEDTQADIRELKKNLKINPISFREGIKNVNL